MSRAYWGYKHWEAQSMSKQGNLSISGKAMGRRITHYSGGIRCTTQMEWIPIEALSMEPWETVERTPGFSTR
ncbi:hypothetical protein [Pasteuria penetrans]|uniref:hypothetical protein n=1 Tax=Pasteuria penetrans TaxID=86005 RepID=UPI0011EF137A|nr:hypothetical protein [Pasteuria penetrans]